MENEDSITSKYKINYETKSPTVQGQNLPSVSETQSSIQRQMTKPFYDFRQANIFEDDKNEQLKGVNADEDQI